MGNHDHNHHHLHHHHHHLSHPDVDKNERSLMFAIIANMALTFVQVIAGVFSGSLALIADALHNFGDAGALVIALMAVKIGRRPPDQFKTFGYKRAETVAALINLTTLIVMGLFLFGEGIKRIFDPEPVTGWTVVAVAGFALLIDVLTAFLTYSQSKHSLNIKAVFLHNLTDAAASIGVMVSGILIIIFGWNWTDAAMTLVIAFYVLWQGAAAMPRAIHILMEGAPQNLDIEQVQKSMAGIEGVKDIHHVHLWCLDEHRIAMEAHVVLNGSVAMEDVKMRLKTMLKKDYAIGHSTLEFETMGHACATC